MDAFRIVVVRALGHWGAEFSKLVIKGIKTLTLAPSSAAMGLTSKFSGQPDPVLSPARFSRDMRPHVTDTNIKLVMKLRKSPPPPLTTKRRYFVT